MGLSLAELFRRKETYHDIVVDGRVVTLTSSQIKYYTDQVTLDNCNNGNRFTDQQKQARFIAYIKRDFAGQGRPIERPSRTASGNGKSRGNTPYGQLRQQKATERVGQMKTNQRQTLINSERNKIKSEENRRRQEEEQASRARANRADDDEFRVTQTRRSAITDLRPSFSNKIAGESSQVGSDFMYNTRKHYIESSVSTDGEKAVYTGWGPGGFFAIVRELVEDVRDGLSQRSEGHVVVKNLDPSMNEEDEATLANHEIYVSKMNDYTGLL